MAIPTTADTNVPCEDPQVIQEWEDFAKQHSHSDEWQRFHAVWLGLCEKVRQGSLDQGRANQLFEDERDSMMRREERRQHRAINPFG